MENVSKEIIGVVGGFGSYATLHFFKRLLDEFPAEKEWERPRIIIDNYCTLPSRVRCILYGEEEKAIINGLISSIDSLIRNNSNHIIITCNTAHYFLDKIYEQIPESKDKIINIIEELAIDLNRNNIKEVSLIASEGTIISRIYHDCFEKYGIKIYTPKEDEFYKMRDLIEVVKQNKDITTEIKNNFINLILEQDTNIVILGCTEFPVLYDEIKDNNLVKNITFYDPLQTAINKIKKETL